MPRHGKLLTLKSSGAETAPAGDEQGFPPFHPRQVDAWGDEPELYLLCSGHAALGGP